MAFFKFKKKKFENEIVLVENLRDWVSFEKKKLGAEEGEFLSEGREMVFELVSELEDRIDVLDKIDLEEKRENKRIKIIVMQNLESYVFHLRKFVKDLKELEAKNAVDFVDKIGSLFSDFAGIASKNYERATILIGDELGFTKKVLDNFFRDFSKKVKGKKGFIDRLRVVERVGDDLDKISDIESARDIEKEEFGSVRDKIGLLENEVKELEKEMTNFKESAEYLNRVEKVRKFENARRDVGKEKVELVSMIDYKKLSGVFHKNDKKMKLIRSYMEGGADALLVDSGEKMIDLLKGAGVATDSFLEKIRKIIDLEKKLREFDVGDDKLAVFIGRLNEIEREVVELKKDEKNAVDIYDKLGENLESVLEDVKNALAGVNVELRRV